jgi:transposase
LFPELTRYLRKPNRPNALTLRTHWPTPALLAEASLADLRAVRRGTNPSLKTLEALRVASLSSIGITNSARVETLCLEQRHLIAQLQLSESQLALVEEKIQALVESSREGQILLSLPAAGPVSAATLLAFIGNIRNFRSAATLRKFCGCAPLETQTGTSHDHAKINPAGGRLLRAEIFRMAARSKLDPDSFWAKLSARLTPRLCVFNSKTHKLEGKSRVNGRIAGQMVGVIYALLRADADLVDSLEEQATLPPPKLYDPKIHSGEKARSPR